MFRHIENGYEWAVAPSNDIPEELTGKLREGGRWVRNPEGWSPQATIGALSIFIRKLPPLQLVSDQNDAA